MNIKNYTSTVLVDRSVSFIEHRLVTAGASHISKVYDEISKQLKGIVFQINVNNSTLMVFRLPAKTDAVKRVLLKDIRRPPPGIDQRIDDQGFF